MEKESDVARMLNPSGELTHLRQENAKLKKTESGLRQIIASLRRSEEFFRVIIQNGADILFITDKQGIITYVSPSVERFLGYRSEELIGRSGFDFIVLTDVPRAMHDFSQALQVNENDVSTNVFHLRHKDGSTRILEGLGVNMMNNPAVSGFVMNVRDITERRQSEEKIDQYRQGLESLVAERTSDLAKSDTQLLVELAERQRIEQALEKSEVRFRELFSRMNGGVSVFESRDNGADFIFKDINHAGERMSDLKRDDILDRSVLAVLPGVRNIGLLEIMQRVWKTGVAEHQPVSLYQDDRLTRWLENVVYKLPSGEIVVVSDDITPRKQTEVALKESEEKYRSLLNDAGEAILSADERGHLLEANRKAAELLGYTVDEIEGSHISRMHPPEEWERIWETFQGLIHKKEKMAIATTILTKDGRKIPVDVSGSLIEYKGQKIIQGIYRDVTGIKLKEDALLSARDEMEQRVHERTSELEKANKDLEEANVALRVLLNRQTEDNKKLEERLQVNIEEMVIPYLEKLKQAGLNGRYNDYLTLLEANLNDIVSPFIQNISAVYRNLTPTEIRVAEMIKQGRASKDIAEVMNSSVGTINTHRNNIRKKLNLRKQNKNLRSYLLTLG